MIRAHYSLTVTLSLMLITGCASVSVQKIDKTTGKVISDAAEGLRFYLPRPYVSVFESFIVSSEVYLAQGEVSPDSSYILLTQVPAGLASIVNKDLALGQQTGMGNLKVNAREVRAVDQQEGSPQSAPATPAASDSPKTGEGATEISPTKTPVDVLPGRLNYKATNDNSAFAVIPQPRYFNILWLPDFDEQYVVSAKAGLGNAGVVIGLGQGWSLQGLEAKVDNSAIAKPLLDFYGATLGSLQKLATAKIEAPLSAITGGPQSANATSFAGGTRVTVKVTKVRIVAPGLYPILKPGEMAQSKLDDMQAKRILAPVPPFTNIAFNTYEAIVIEAARPSGDSALRIQQYVDTASPASSASTQNQANPNPNMPGTDLALKNLRIELSKPENTTTNKEYFVPTLTQDATGAIKITIKKQTGGAVGTLANLLDDATLKAKVVDIMKANNVPVDPQNINVIR